MIDMKKVELVYSNGVKALRDINTSIEKGEFVFLVGPTGSGKSSFFKLIYRDILPTRGDVYVESQDIVYLKESQIPYLRRKLGIVFQDFKLLPYKTVYENVSYALEVIGKSTAQIKKRVISVLKMVGLDGKKKMLPDELSAGEQQRISIARALVNNPLILLADEPTGNLDPKTSIEIIKLLEEINIQGTTVVVATHDRDIVDKLQKRVIVISGGRIIEDKEKTGYYFPANIFKGLKKNN